MLGREELSLTRDQTPTCLLAGSGLNALLRPQPRGMQRGRAANPLAKMCGTTAHILRSPRIPTFCVTDFTLPQPTKGPLTGMTQLATLERVCSKGFRIMSLFRAALMLPAIALSACAATTPKTIGPRVDNAPTASLWQAHRDPRLTPLQLAFVEAELASRGATSSGSSYIGQKTASAYGKSLYSRGSATSTVSSDRDCADFASPWQAQRFFLDSGGPLTDPHNLDRDGDGLACEWGTTLRSNSRKARATAPVRARPTYSSSRCYVGPRGGTYTITASGNKNYGGC